MQTTMMMDEVPPAVWGKLGILIGQVLRVFPDAEFTFGYRPDPVFIHLPPTMVLDVFVRRADQIYNYRESINVRALSHSQDQDSFFEILLRTLIQALGGAIARNPDDKP